MEVTLRCHKMKTQSQWSMTELQFYRHNPQCLILDVSFVLRPSTSCTSLCESLLRLCQL